MTVIADAFKSGYKKGWDKCREELCNKYNLNKKEVLAWENLNKDLDKFYDKSENHEEVGEQ